MPIKSDGLSCLPSYRSREETRHTRVILVGIKSGIAAIAGIEEKEGKEGQQACRRRGRDDGRLLGRKRNAMGQEGDALQETRSQNHSMAEAGCNNGGRKSLTCKACSKACVTISHAWTSCPGPGLDSGFSKRWSCGR